VSCNIDSSESESLFINFQLNLMTKDVDEKLIDEIESKSQLGDIDINKKFHFMLAKHRLIQMKGFLTISTVSSNSLSLSICMPYGN